MFFVALLLFLLTRIEQRLGPGVIAAAGAATGALILNRENAFVLVPILVLWLLTSRRDDAARVAGLRAAIFLTGAFAVLLPVGLRNYHVGGTFALTTSHLGPNFYIGNNPRASGSYESLLPGRGDPISRR